MFEISDKVALITGGASGIGLQYAIELLKNGLRGVTLADINEEFGEKALNDLSEQFGNGKVLFIKVDVSDKNLLEDAFKQTVEKFNNIDILINNAGIMDDSVWEKEIDINIVSSFSTISKKENIFKLQKGTINGTLLAIQKYIHNYKSGNEGVIVNISSVAGSDPAPILPVYSATKYAVIGLTRSFGTLMHYEISGVRIFAICPGFTDTPLLSNIEEKSLRYDYGKSYREVKHLLVYQKPENVARHAVNLIKTAPQGSVWIIENKDEAYEYKYIHRKQMKKLTLKV
ncbi:hypothetical protein FQR65_LT07700 [Abscondita terminalis]|nr:hypothetical protein FQR65_LT07700 [Abscondita terminalis]